jgi:hypothetical protein
MCENQKEYFKKLGKNPSTIDSALYCLRCNRIKRTSAKPIRKTF